MAGEVKDGWRKEVGMFGLSALTAGVVLDWIFGDPSWLPHPVVLMGKLIKGAEEYLRRRLSGRELTAGILLVCAVVLSARLSL